MELDLSFKINYPKAKKVDKIDEYKTVDGSTVSVKDPYRWLEDPDSEATKKWIKEETELTDKYFKESKIMKKIKKSLNNVR